MPVRKVGKNTQINLLPKEGLASTTSGRVLLWILTTFRAVLIFTEIIVIAAFISRFWLDAKNSNVTENIEGAKSAIMSLSVFEKDFKVTQDKLAIYENYKQGKGKFLKGIEEVVSYKPEGVFFESVTSDNQRVVVKATSLAESGIHQYLANLNSSDKFESVKLESIDLLDNQILFGFTIVSYFKSI